jgi:two-component system chemotaxis response regulator CheB
MAVGPPIVVVGASAGGVTALTEVVSGLPAGFPAAVFVVLHVSGGGSSSLSEILDRAGPLPAVAARSGEPITPGTITVAGADWHLLLRSDGVRLARGPKVNGHRPAVDVLFRSASRAFGPRVTGVVLSGALSDGTSGLAEIKRRGGRAVVQADAVHQGMPTSAIENVDVDAVVALRDIAATLTMLTRETEAVGVGEDTVVEPDIEEGLDAGVATAVGDLTPYRCPECGGGMWEIDEGPFGGFVCHVGHAFSADSMLTLQGDEAERALWRAVRLLEEQAAMNERLASRLEAHGTSHSNTRLRGRARQALEDAGVIRAMLEGALEPGADDPQDEAA